MIKRSQKAFSFMPKDKCTKHPPTIIIIINAFLMCQIPSYNACMWEVQNAKHETLHNLIYSSLHAQITCVKSHLHTHICTLAPSCTCTHAHTRMHTRKHTHTHAHTHTPTHLFVQLALFLQTCLACAESELGSFCGVLQTKSVKS